MADDEMSPQQEEAAMDAAREWNAKRDHLHDISAHITIEVVTVTSPWKNVAPNCMRKSSVNGQAMAVKSKSANSAQLPASLTFRKRTAPTWIGNKTVSAPAGEPGETHGTRMRHDR